MNKHYAHYLAIKSARPDITARDAAVIMNISEAALTLARCVADARALRPDFPALLKALEAVGETKSIVRDRYAVHEQTGVYSNLRLGHMPGWY